MTHCRRCEQPRLEDVLVDDHAEVAGHTFTAQLPGRRCRACGTVAIDGRHVRQFELSIAAMLARTGQREHRAFRYMRGVLDLTVEDTAQLCGVDAELVQLWESGRVPASARSVALISALVLSKAGERAVSVDGLGMLRSPRPLARRVRVSLEGRGLSPGRAQGFSGVASQATARA